MSYVFKKHSNLVINEHKDNEGVFHQAHCIAVSRESYLYMRRNFHHHYFEHEGNHIIVTGNFRVPKEMAIKMFEALVAGKFKHEDTGDWD